MDYKEQIGQAKNAAEKWRAKYPIVGVGELRVDLMVDDLTRSISDLLARAEAAEAAQETMQRAMEEYKERAEKAERERDAAVTDIQNMLKSLPHLDFCGLCARSYDDCEEGETGVCKPVWIGPREE